MILKVAVPSPLRRSFDYLPVNSAAAALPPGIRLKVPFGKRSVVGVLLATVEQSDIATEKLKQIEVVLDEQALFDKNTFALLKWVANYYHHPIGEVIHTALPVWLRKGKPLIPKRACPEPGINTINQQAPKLEQQQITAIQQVEKSLDKFQPFLLDGVTGSGKTEVYIQLISHIVAQEKQALLLIPEIALTPQTVSRFQQRFTQPITTLHSSLTEKERHCAWLQAQIGAAKIIIGTRSAILASIPNLAIIIIDEEHDPSYKQQDGLRYSARDVALVRAKQKNIPILLGSATPSLKSLYQAEKGNYQYLQLPKRTGVAATPTLTLLDIRSHKLREGISELLLTEIKKHLSKDNQVLLFLNQRGYAPTIMCHDCGWSITCQRCDARMTYHHKKNLLICHHCNKEQPVSSNSCPKCNSDSLIPVGVGTERVEQALLSQLDEHEVIRVDRDSTRNKGAMDKVLDKVLTGGSKVLLGTQMLAKGHHFPDITLVGVLNADSGLLSTDFNAPEQMAQLLVQVAGRAGRAQKKGEVLIQTHYPDHPLLQTLVNAGYKEFAQQLLTERREAALPPYTHFAIFRAEANKQQPPKLFLQQLADKINSKQVEKFGPIPSPMERKAGRYRAQLLLQSSSRKQLQSLLTQLVKEIDTIPSKHRVRWSLDVDPIDLN